MLEPSQTLRGDKVESHLGLAGLRRRAIDYRLMTAALQVTETPMIATGTAVRVCRARRFASRERIRRGEEGLVEDQRFARTAADLHHRPHVLYGSSEETRKSPEASPHRARRIGAASGLGGEAARPPGAAGVVERGAWQVRI